MDLKQLQHFVASVDSGSFKKAAEILYTSQPHISKTIKSLEAELQTELLKRGARGVEVTEAGKKVYEYACRILVDSGKILEVREEQELSRLRIMALPSDRLASWFGQFYRRYWESGLHADYVEGNPEAVFQALHRHTAELGLVSVSQNQMTAFRQTLEYKRLEFTELGQGEPVLFAGPKSPVYHAGHVSSKELRELRFVQMKDNQDSLNINLIQGSEDCHSLRRRGQILTTNSRKLLFQMLVETELCSMGNSLLPEFADQEAIRQIPIRGAQEVIRFGYIWRKRDGISAPAEEFLRFLSERLQ